MPSAIRLRDVIQSDLPIFFEHQLEPNATKMAAFPARDEESFMKHWSKIMTDESVLIQTILFNNQVVGNILCFEMEGEKEIGYWLGKEFWGKGIASEAVRQFLGQVMKRPLYAHVTKHNRASQKVLEKCGFKVIGEDTWKPDLNQAEIEELILKLE